jgi:predicted transcriptional regulator
VPGPTGPIEENDMATMDYTPCGLPVPGTKQTCMRKQKHHDACRTTLTDPVKAAKRQEQMAARLARQETEDVIESVVTATKATPETRMKVAKRVAAVAK